MNASLKIDETKTIIFNVSSKNNHPDNVEDFKDIHSPEGTEMKLQMSQKHDRRRAELGLLRIAYLEAFSRLGHGFVLNENLGPIRYQILHPEEDILPECFWFNYDFPDDMLGVNIVTRPIDFRCFLVVFDLECNGVTKRNGIILPGWNSDSLKIYKDLNEKFIVDGLSEDVQVENFDEKNTNFITDSENVLNSLFLWREVCEKT